MRPGGYGAAHPGPADVLPLIEVANSGLRTDRTVKARLCARHGIPEYRIVDLAGRAPERHRDPAPEGHRAVDRLGPGDGTVAPAAPPGLVPRLGEVLG